MHRAEARGELLSEAAESLRHSLEPGELCPLAERIRTHARAADWTGLLSVTEGASATERSQVLADGETLIVLRKTVHDERVWYALIDSLNGELDVSQLLEQDSSASNWLQWGLKVGTTGFRFPLAVSQGNSIGSLWADSDASFDVDAILKARRGGMDVNERALDAAAMTVDADVWRVLSRTVGEGSDRATSEQSLQAGAARQATDPALDAQALTALGTGGQDTDLAAGTEHGW